MKEVKSKYLFILMKNSKYKNKISILVKIVVVFIKYLSCSYEMKMCVVKMFFIGFELIFFYIFFVKCCLCFYFVDVLCFDFY